MLSATAMGESICDLHTMLRALLQTASRRLLGHNLSRPLGNTRAHYLAEDCHGYWYLPWSERPIWTSLLNQPANGV